MRQLKDFWSSLRTYLLEEISVNIIPAPDRDIKTIKFRRLIPVLIIFILLAAIISLGCLYKYYEGNYSLLADRELGMEELRQENRILKKRLYDLNQETEELEESVKELKADNNRIIGILQLGLGPEEGEVEEMPVSLEYELSGGEYDSREIDQESRALDLFSMDSRELLLQTQVNIINVKQEVNTRKEELADLEAYARQYNELISATPGIWPLADRGDSFISSEFGWRKDPFTGERAVHEGLDIGVWYNTPVLATADGRVSFVGWSGGYGRLVIIKHKTGYETRYGHLNGYRVKKGEEVERGQIIALSGNSGRSTGPHLHYEVRKDGIPENPRKYIGTEYRGKL